MRTFVDTVEARNGILDYLEDRPEAVPEAVREALRAASREVPVEACVRAAKLIYARRAECPPTLQDLGGGLAAVLQSERFHDFHVNNLGRRMAGALRRDAGVLPEGVEAQDAAEDPAPDPAFVAPAPEAPAA